jgi:DtxR family transcriptional regulator, Mn-dependent transcriptional regulator
MKATSETNINTAAHWREFDRNTLSHSMAHYLMAIHHLRNTLGYARTTDVAEMLEVSKGAASMALAQLKKRGWVGEDPNRFLLLTDEGLRVTHLVENNFETLSRFFERVLGVDANTAFSDACKMEHLMSMETGRRLMALMRYLLQDEKLAASIRTQIERFDGSIPLPRAAEAQNTEQVQRP